MPPCTGPQLTFSQEEPIMPLSREGLIHSLVVHGYAELDRRFVRATSPLDHLAFHNPEHSIGVAERAERIFRAGFVPTNEIRTLEQGLELVRVIAPYHDIDQEWTEGRQKDAYGSWIIRAAVPGREARSFGDLRHELEDRQIIDAFTAAELAIMEEGFNATMAVYDEDLGTLIQPTLTSESSLVAQAIAMADLSYPGMVGGETYCRVGDALFRENNIGISQMIIDAQRGLLPNKNLEHAIAERIRAWSHQLIVFAHQRHRHFEQELEFLPRDKQSAVDALFTTWDFAVNYARQVSAWRQKMSDVDVIRDIGYTYP